MNALLFSIAGFDFSVDTVVAVALLVFAVIGLFKGLFKELVGFIGTVVAFALAVAFCAKLAQFLIDKTSLNASIASLIVSNFPSDEIAVSELPNALAALNIPSFLTSPILDYAAFLGTETVIVADVVSGTFAKYVLIIISFVAIVLLVKLACFILKTIFKAVKRIPGVGLMDRLLGAVLGVIKGLIWVCGILYVIDFFPIPALDGLKTEIAASPFVSFLAQYNIYAWLFSFISF